MTRLLRSILTVACLFVFLDTASAFLWRNNTFRQKTVVRGGLGAACYGSSGFVAPLGAGFVTTPVATGFVSPVGFSSAVGFGGIQYSSSGLVAPVGVGFVTSAPSTGFISSNLGTAVNLMPDTVAVPPPVIGNQFSAGFGSCYGSSAGFGASGFRGGRSRFNAAGLSDDVEGINPPSSSFDAASILSLIRVFREIFLNPNAGGGQSPIIPDSSSNQAIRRLETKIDTLETSVTRLTQRVEDISDKLDRELRSDRESGRSGRIDRRDSDVERILTRMSNDINANLESFDKRLRVLEDKQKK